MLTWLIFDHHEKCIGHRRYHILHTSIPATACHPDPDDLNKLHRDSASGLATQLGSHRTRRIASPSRSIDCSRHGETTPSRTTPPGSCCIRLDITSSPAWTWLCASGRAKLQLSGELSVGSRSAHPLIRSAMLRSPRGSSPCEPSATRGPSGYRRHLLPYQFATEW
jgi:hypothetical protein